jgi:antitoxin ParD1/3/4
MSTMNISLPEALKEFVDRRVNQDGYSTSSEYVRELIRADQVRRAERELALLLREGLESGEGIPVNRAYWAGKRRRMARGRS